jgi:vacuolar-type H+-ATPase subunit I/STV1
MGLLLFTAIFALIVSIFHWAFSTRVYLILFVITGVFAGTGAGILHQSPFGKSLNCQKPDSFFPEAYQPYIGDCARVMAISGLAWALCKFCFSTSLTICSLLVGLSVIGLVYSFFDHFKLSVRNTKVYDIEKEPTIIEKNLDRTESGNTAHTTTA